MAGPWESTWCLSVAGTAGKNIPSGAELLRQKPPPGAEMRYIRSPVQKPKPIIPLSLA